MISQGCWFLFQHQFYEFPTLNSFLGKFGPKKSKLFVLSKSWHTWYLEDADSCFKICFLNFELKINFQSNLGQKSQICSFCLKIGTLGILRMRILIFYKKIRYPFSTRILEQLVVLFGCEIHKKLPRGVRKKRCSKNIQQIYRSTLMQQCDFNKVALHFGMDVLL